MTSHLLPNLAAVQNVTVSDFANYITRTRRHVTCRAPCTELFTSTSAHLVTLHIDLFGTYDSMTRTWDTYLFGTLGPHWFHPSARGTLAGRQGQGLRLRSLAIDRPGRKHT